MPCYTLHDKNGKAVGHLCGELGPHCACCGGVSGYLCDYPVGEDKTCDRPLCNVHAAEVAPELHYCPGHLQEWQAFMESGGVKKQLVSVVPFARGHWVNVPKGEG